MSSEERFRGGDQPRDVGGSSSFPDPLIDSLEELAALGALDNDAALQEYVSFFFVVTSFMPLCRCINYTVYELLA